MQTKSNTDFVSTAFFTSGDKGLWKMSIRTPLEKLKQEVSEKGHKSKIQIKRHTCITQVRETDSQTQCVFTLNKYPFSRPKALSGYCT